MDFLHFNNVVLSIVGDPACKNYEYILRTVQEPFRERYIQTLKQGFELEASYNHLTKGSSLPDKNYSRYLHFCKLMQEYAAA